MYRAWAPPPYLLELAARYGLRAAGSAPCIHEGIDVSAGFAWSERHLRCVWADPAYRPVPLITTDGQLLTIDGPGRWNLEAGPDFLDATVRLAPGERRLRGDVELHVRPGDWIRHRHAADPHYRNVIVHVTYYPGQLAADALPPGAVQVSLQEGLERQTTFSFDSIDVLAYPYAATVPGPPCARVLAEWHPEAQAGLLEAAGAERLRRKSERMAIAIGARGTAQALYEESLALLGAKYNRRPCRSLATRVSLTDLRRAADAGGVIAAYALLCGVAGLLPARSLSSWDAETRRFVRQVWDIWWKKASSWEGRLLDPAQWRLHNQRPQNHPLRRLMAAAELFASPLLLPEQLEQLVRRDDSSIQAAVHALGDTGLNGYWAFRHSLAGARLEAPLALIGPGRAATLLNNAIAPWLMVQHPEARFTRRLLHDLPHEDDNRLIRHTAHALFGHDHNPTLYRTGLRQQGLLQLFHDFCLDSRAGCAGCPFPDWLRHQKAYDAVART